MSGSTRTSRVESYAASPACRLRAWSSAPRSQARQARRTPVRRVESTMPRIMEITTPIDGLLFHTMHAREELSRVGECHVDLLSLKNDINLDQILGKNVTVKLELQDGGTRFFNGFVSRFSQGGTYGRYKRYHAVVHPWLW